MEKKQQVTVQPQPTLSLAELEAITGGRTRLGRVVKAKPRRGSGGGRRGEW